MGFLKGYLEAWRTLLFILICILLLPIVWPTDKLPKMHNFWEKTDRFLRKVFKPSHYI
jgi:hypothetical protein